MYRTVVRLLCCATVYDYGTIVLRLLCDCGSTAVRRSKCACELLYDCCTTFVRLLWIAV